MTEWQLSDEGGKEKHGGLLQKDLPVSKFVASGKKAFFIWLQQKSR